MREREREREIASFVKTKTRMHTTDCPVWDPYSEMLQVVKFVSICVVNEVHRYVVNKTKYQGWGRKNPWLISMLNSHASSSLFSTHRLLLCYITMRLVCYKIHQYTTVSKKNVLFNTPNNKEIFPGKLQNFTSSL